MLRYHKRNITKSLSVIFQSEGYDILKPSTGFSTVKKCFGSNVVVAAIFDILLLLLINANNNNDDNRIIIVNSIYLTGRKYILILISQSIPRNSV